MFKRILSVVFFVLLALFWAMMARGQNSAENLPASVPIWDPSTQASATRFGESTSRLASLVLNGDGSRLIISGVDHEQQASRMWDVRRKVLLYSFEMGVDSKSFVAFTPNDSQLYVDNFVVDASKNRAVRTFNLTQYTPYYAVATNPKGTRLLGYQDDVLKLWDLGTGRPLQSFGRVAIASSSTMALSPDGSRVAVADEQRQVQVWDSGSGKRVQRFQSGMDILNTLSFSPDGSKLLLGGQVTPFWPVDAVEVKVWDLEQKAWVGQFKAPFGETLKLAMSADGSSILAAQRTILSLGFWRWLNGESPTHERYRILMWNTRSGARTTLVEQVQSIRSSTPVAFSADGSSVAVEVAQEIWVFKP